MRLLGSSDEMQLLQSDWSNAMECEAILESFPSKMNHNTSNAIININIIIISIIIIRIKISHAMLGRESFPIGMHGDYYNPMQCVATTVKNPTFTIGMLNPLECIIITTMHDALLTVQNQVAPLCIWGFFREAKCEH